MTMWKIILPPTLALLLAFTFAMFSAIQVGTVMRAGEFAYIVNDNSSMRLYLLDVDHRLGYRLANAPLANNYFVWSPDGTSVAFISVAGAASEIFIAGADGHSLRQLTVNSVPEHSPAWSPNGQYLVFSRQAIDNAESTDLVIMNVETREERLLTNSLEIEASPIWSPDGTRIAYIVVSSRGHQIKIIDAQTGELQAQVNELTGNLNDLSWSPDGTRLMFTNVEVRVSIYVMELASNRITQLTDEAHHNETPMWSPDGRQIVFVSNRDGNLELYIMNADGTNQQRLTNDQTALEAFPAWAVDGNRIAYAEFITTDIYVMNADGSQIQQYPVASALGQMVIRWRP
jgi:Tol biopolymer transport system component